MVKLRCRLIVLISIVILILLPILDSRASVMKAPKESIISQVEYETYQLVPDPYFDEPPEVYIAGNSNEFSYQYNQYIDKNEVTLTWNHSAGVKLNFSNQHLVPFGCDDHIYLKKTFEWSHEVIPHAVNISARYRVDLTDSFLSEPDGSYLFHSNAWIQNSLGLWSHGLHFSSDQHEISERWQILNPVYRSRLFEHLVEDENGIQMAPNDTLTLLIGISPSLYFNGNGTDGPWKQYNGTVSVSIEKFEMNVLTASDDIETTVAIPDEEQVWSQRVVDFDPSIEALQDGSIYVMGNNVSGAIYDGIVLAKFDSELNAMWDYKSDESAPVYGEEMTIDSEAVYVCGYTTYELTVLKMSHSGDVIWRKLFDFEDLDFVSTKGITVSNGDIYVMSVQSRVVDGDYGLWNIVTKIDTSGSVVWNKIVHRIETYSGLIDSDDQGNIYTIFGSNLTKWDKDGTMLWNIEDNQSIFYSIEISPVGSIYVAKIKQLGHYSGITSIIKYNKDGIEQWSYSPRVDYTDGFTEIIYTADIETDPQESVFLLLNYAGINLGMHIEKLSPEGSHIQNMTLSRVDDETQMAYYQIYSFTVPGNNYVYTISTNWSSSGYRYMIRRYYDNTYYSPTTMLYYILPVVGVAGLVIILVAVDRFHFKKDESVELQAQA